MTQERLINERHFFIENKKKNIYCVEYLPKNKKMNHGVILCKSIWGERNRTHRIFTNLSRELSNNGFSVITCDYYGDGNSGGGTLDMTFSGIVNDIETMYKYMKNQLCIEAISMIGFRIGANCLISAVEKFEYLHSIILIEPEKDLSAFLTKKLRSNISNQMAVHKKITKNREELINDIINDKPVNMDGSLLGKKLWESFEEASPLKTIKGDFKSILVLNLLENRKKLKNINDFSFLIDGYENAKIEVIEKEFIWHDWKTNVQYPLVFFNKIIAELKAFMKDTSHEEL